MRRRFDEELQKLNNDLIEMGTLVETALEQTKIAVKEQDHQLAQEIILNDRQINDLEKEIESLCFTLMLRQQPVATDLRTITMALKVVTDLERIGDHAADICEILLEIKGEYPYRTVEHIPIMFKTCRKMVYEVIHAYVEGDLERGKNADVMDDIIDKLFDDVKNEIVEIIKEKSERIDDCLDYLMIAKHLERIGDHATNIYEWLEFLMTGKLEDTQ